MRNIDKKSEVAVENLSKNYKINRKTTKSGFTILSVNHKDNKKSILIESENLLFNSLTKKNQLIYLIKNRLNKFLLSHSDINNILIVGLGNKNINCDCLGPKTCNKIINSNSNIIFKPKCKIFTICPDVIGKTGIDTINIINSVKNVVDANLVILIDSLSTREIKRIASSIQISSLNLTPGSGSKLQSKNLSSSLLKVPTISIGIPLVSFIFNKQDSFKNLIITPKDISFITDFYSDVISSSINLLFYNITLRELEKYKI